MTKQALMQVNPAAYISPEVGREHLYHRFRDHGGRPYFVRVQRMFPHGVFKKLAYNEERRKKKRWLN